MGERKGFVSRKRIGPWALLVVLVALSVSGCEMDPSSRRHLNALWILALIALLVHGLIFMVSQDQEFPPMGSCICGLLMAICFVVSISIHLGTTDAEHASSKFELKEGEITACEVLTSIFAPIGVCSACFVMVLYVQKKDHSDDRFKEHICCLWCLFQCGLFFGLGPAIWLGSSVDLVTTTSTTTNTVSTTTGTTSTTTTTAPPWTLGVHPAIGVFVVEVVFLVPISMWIYLCISTEKYPGTNSVEFILAAGDFSSDMLFALLGQFYDKILCVLLVIAALAPATIQVVWVFFRGGRCWPPFLTALSGMCVLEPVEYLRANGGNTVYEKVEGKLERFIANMAVTVLLSLWLPFGLVVVLIGCILWPCALFALGVFLQSTRLLLFRQIFRGYAKLWGKDDTFIDSHCTDSKDADMDFLPLAYHRSVISEIITEAFPSIAINIVNGVLLDRDWDFVAIFALTFSCYITVRCAFKYTYYLAWEGKQLQEIPCKLIGDSALSFLGRNEDQA